MHTNKLRREDYVCLLTLQCTVTTPVGAAFLVHVEMFLQLKMGILTLTWRLVYMHISRLFYVQSSHYLSKARDRLEGVEQRAVVVP
jgi:hypothetical protein